MHTAQTTTDAYDGYTVHEVEALHKDHLETQVSFAPTTGAALSSTATLRFQVPDHGAKATFEIDGVKYYRVVPTSQTAEHDPVATR